MSDFKVTATFYGVDIKSIKSRFFKVLNVTEDEILKVIADDFLKFFKRGLRSNGLGLVALRPSTVAKKVRAGYRFPDSPLYGKGESYPMSFVSNVIVSKVDKGYLVAPSETSHYSGMPVVKLALLHAEGYKVGKTSVPQRNPILEARKRFKVSDSKFIIGKILANRFKEFWK